MPEERCEGVERLAHRRRCRGVVDPTDHILGGLITQKRSFLRSPMLCRCKRQPGAPGRLSAERSVLDGGRARRILNILTAEPEAGPAVVIAENSAGEAEV